MKASAQFAPESTDPDEQARNPAGCARCDRTGVRIATTWPEGRICRRCYERATRIHGICPGCNTHRLLPGIIDGHPACAECAGIPKDFHCTRCGREDEPVRTGLCAHCCLTDDLTELMAGQHGSVSAELQPLFNALTTQKHARSARIWLIVNPDATTLIRDLAQGTLPLEHTTFTEHIHPGKVAFLRELCLEHGLLPPINLEIERFQAWAAHKVATIHTEDGRLIRQYVRWVHLLAVALFDDGGVVPFDDMFGWCCRHGDVLVGIGDGVRGRPRVVVVMVTAGRGHDDAPLVPSFQVRRGTARSRPRANIMISVHGGRLESRIRR